MRTMKKVLSCLTMLSLLAVLVFVPGINTKAAQSRTFNLGRYDQGTTVSYPLGLRLETPGSFAAYNLGNGLQLVEDGNGMLTVTGTTTSYASRNVSINGVRCLTDPTNPTSGDTFDLLINFEVLREFNADITFVNSSGTTISHQTKAYKMGVNDVEWLNLYSFFPNPYIPDPASSNPNDRYTIRTPQTVSSTYNGGFRVTGTIPEVRVSYDMLDAIITNVQYTIVCDKVTTPTPSATSRPYRVNYVEKATGNVVYSQDGIANADNSWVNIRTEFNYAGSNYRIEPVQAYPNTQYRYATASNAAQVCVIFANTGADGYVTYNIVSVKKPETTMASPSNSSGSGSTTTTTRSVKQGWILSNGEWYYYVGGVRTNLKKGWHKDSQDGFWYYLNGADGRMLKGWNLINNEWYYLAPYTPMPTWELRSDGEWYYMHKKNSRPLGSMYTNETTPDGYRVDGSGKYIK